MKEIRIVKSATFQNCFDLYVDGIRHLIDESFSICDKVKECLECKEWEPSEIQEVADAMNDPDPFDVY